MGFSHRGGFLPLGFAIALIPPHPTPPHPIPPHPASSRPIPPHQNATVAFLGRSPSLPQTSLGERSPSECAVLYRPSKGSKVQWGAMARAILNRIKNATVAFLGAIAFPSPNFPRLPWGKRSPRWTDTGPRYPQALRVGIVALSQWRNGLN